MKRYDSLPDDARPWLKEAGRLTIALDRLHTEAEAISATLGNGTGRRRRQQEKLRGQLKSLERRAARARASLEAAERRLEELAHSNGHGRDPLADLLRGADR